jgi:hypothetical protein
MENPSMTNTLPGLPETFKCSLSGEVGCSRPGNPGKARWFYKHRQILKDGKRQARIALAAAKQAYLELPFHRFKSDAPLLSQKEAFLANLSAKRNARKRCSKSTKVRSFTRAKAFIMREVHGNKKKAIREQKALLRERLINDFDFLDYETDPIHRQALCELGYYSPLKGVITDGYKIWWMREVYSELKAKIDHLELDNNRTPCVDAYDHWEDVSRYAPIVISSKEEVVSTTAIPVLSRTQRTNARKRRNEKLRKYLHEDHEQH